VSNILITGGAGFIGHHLVDFLLHNRPEADITIIDRLDISGNLNRLAEIGAAKHRRVRFVYHDLKAPINDMLCKQLGLFTHIIHLGAATHIDRSIIDPLSFVYDNVVGTCNILDFARKTGCYKFFYFSTDEVFGVAAPGVAFKEDDPYHSTNPYSASKAGGEELAIAYHNTYGVPAIITHTMNVVGRRQHPEKFVPMTIALVNASQKVIIHANPARTVSGSRFYIGAPQVASAIDFLMKHGVPGQKYNIVGERELTNLEVATIIADAQDKVLKFELVDFHSSRPGHDLRYALDGAKMRGMGWQPRVLIEDTLREITHWSLKNSHWLPSLGQEC
jgi:dTDP-glucose 4,6-dehydratase